MKAFAIADLVASGAATGRQYLEFVRAESMSVGVYVLPAGCDDGQKPHTEDEVYVGAVRHGALHIRRSDAPVQRGDTLFVAAGVTHRFHDITDELRLIVVFAPPEGSGADR